MQKCLIIRLKNLIDEDFINYKKPSMMLATCICDWKCLRENKLDISICQNSQLANQVTVDISIDKIIDRYINSSITQAIVIGGLEPFLQFEEVVQFINRFRQKTNDDVVIYTGYYPDELTEQIKILKNYSNIIIKFGRYILNSESIYDDILGVTLASKNQFARKIS